MGKNLLPINASITEILAQNDYEIESIVNKAITDMIGDTFSKFKDVNAKRSVAIELSIARIGTDGVYVDAKVTPKPAPYTQRPDVKEKTAPGQMSMDEVLDAEVVESEEDMLNEDAEDDQKQIENRKRYLAITGGGKKKKK